MPDLWARAGRCGKGKDAGEMKLLITGDWHLRASRPERRTEEDFAAVCLGKVNQVLDIAEREECRLIIQPGDFFHTPRPSGELVVGLMVLLKQHDFLRRADLLTIHGQHDLAYHSKAARESSMLRILDVGGLLWLLDYREVDEKKGNNNLIEDFTVSTVTTEVCIRGAGWGQEPPPPPEEHYDCKVLVAHAMVGDKKLWPSQELTGPADWVRKHPGYDLYVLGDYHYPFMEKVGDALVVNAGVLIRQQYSERELNHRPQVVAYDTETRKTKTIYLDVAPAEKAFSPPSARSEKAEQFEEFTRRLQEQGKVGVDFESNLQAFLEAYETPPKVREAVWQAVKEAKETKETRRGG